MAQVKQMAGDSIVLLSNDGDDDDQYLENTFSSDDVQFSDSTDGLYDQGKNDET